MKRALIRALWGIYKKDEKHPEIINTLSQKHCDLTVSRYLSRRNKMDRDMYKIWRNKLNDPFIVYVFGKENFEKVKTFGFNAVLINENPAPFNLITETYRNKLEIIKYAMEVDGYDEIVYMDWDTIPTKKLLPNFWDILGKKEVFQANLQTYCRRKCPWRRSGDFRKVPNGGFIYIRDKSIPSKVISYWEELCLKKIQSDNDEPAFAMLTDNMVGGWKGIDLYWKLFEPEVCNLYKSSSFPKEQIAQKNICFMHYIQAKGR